MWKKLKNALKSAGSQLGSALGEWLFGGQR